MSSLTPRAQPGSSRELDVFDMPGTGADDEVSITLSMLEEDRFPVRTFTLDSSHPVHIGRYSVSSSGRGERVLSSANNAIVDNPIVSRAHAEFSIGTSVGDVKITDLGSLHGTYLNGVRLRPNEPTEVQNSDVVALGKAAFVDEPRKVFPHNPKYKTCTFVVKIEKRFERRHTTDLPRLSTVVPQPLTPFIDLTSPVPRPSSLAATTAPAVAPPAPSASHEGRSASQPYSVPDSPSSESDEDPRDGETCVQAPWVVEALARPTHSTLDMMIEDSDGGERESSVESDEPYGEDSSMSDVSDVSDISDVSDASSALSDSSSVREESVVSLRDDEDPFEGTAGSSFAEAYNATAADELTHDVAADTVEREEDARSLLLPGGTEPSKSFDIPKVRPSSTMAASATQSSQQAGTTHPQITDDANRGLDGDQNPSVRQMASSALHRDPASSRSAPFSGLGGITRRPHYPWPYACATAALAEAASRRWASTSQVVADNATRKVGEVVKPLDLTPSDGAGNEKPFWHQHSPRTPVKDASEQLPVDSGVKMTSTSDPMGREGFRALPWTRSWVRPTQDGSTADTLVPSPYPSLQTFYAPDAPRQWPSTRLPDGEGVQPRQDAGPSQTAVAPQPEATLPWLMGVHPHGRLLHPTTPDVGEPGCVGVSRVSISSIVEPTDAVSSMTSKAAETDQRIAAAVTATAGTGLFAHETSTVARDVARSAGLKRRIDELTNPTAPGQEAQPRLDLTKSTATQTLQETGHVGCSNEGETVRSKRNVHFAPDTLFRDAITDQSCVSEASSFGQSSDANNAQDAVERPSKIFRLSYTLPKQESKSAYRSKKKAAGYFAKTAGIFAAGLVAGAIGAVGALATLPDSLF